jgi:hypothetical protein
MNKTAVKALIAEYNAAKNERLELDRKSAKLKVQEDLCLDKLVAEKVASGTYGPYLLEASEKKVPRCTDWAGLHAFIKQEGAFELLHKRITDTAIMERVNAGEIVPGIVVDVKPVYKISAA